MLLIKFDLDVQQTHLWFVDYHVTDVYGFNTITLLMSMVLRPSCIRCLVLRLSCNRCLWFEDYHVMDVYGL